MATQTVQQARRGVNRNWASRSAGCYQARLSEKREDDSVAMRRLGYRVVSSREYERSALGIIYFKVTYELVEPPK
jgi:hypothetical protein